MTIALFVLTVILSALFSGLETGIYTTSRLRLFLDANAGIEAARKARILLADMPSLLSVLLVSNNVANWGASFSAQAILVSAEVPHSEVVGTLGVSVVLFLCSESVPKSAFRRGREMLLYPTMPALWGTHRLLSKVLAPISWFAVQLTRVVERRVTGAHAPHKGRREAVLDTGAAEGFLTGFQKRVATGVLAMRERTVGQHARDLQCFPTARLGGDGGGMASTGGDGSMLSLPADIREHRVLVLDTDGRQVLGWMPLAALWQPDGFRAPRRSELRPVARVEASTSLDRAYVHIDRMAAPFAVLPDLRILDANVLRQEVMGTLGGEGGA